MSTTNQTKNTRLAIEWDFRAFPKKKNKKKQTEIKMKQNKLSSIQSPIISVFKVM